MSTNEALIIDVRTPQEFAGGHVEGSINLPLDRFAQEIASVAPDKSATLILCCATGGRSGMACQFMQQMGYLKVTNGGGAANVSAALGKAFVR